MRRFFLFHELTEFRLYIACEESIGDYSFTAVLMWYQQTYQVTNYVLQKRVFEKGASGD